MLTLRTRNIELREGSSARSTAAHILRTPCGTILSKTRVQCWIAVHKHTHSLNIPNVIIQDQRERTNETRQLLSAIAWLATMLGFYFTNMHQSNSQCEVAQ